MRVRFIDNFKTNKRLRAELEDTKIQLQRTEAELTHCYTVNHDNQLKEDNIRPQVWPALAKALGIDIPADVALYLGTLITYYLAKRR